MTRVSFLGFGKDSTALMSEGFLWALFYWNQNETPRQKKQNLQIIVLLKVCKEKNKLQQLKAIKMAASIYEP